MHMCLYVCVYVCTGVRVCVRVCVRVYVCVMDWLDTLSDMHVWFRYVMLCNVHVCRPRADLPELSNGVCILTEAVVACGEDHYLCTSTALATGASVTVGGSAGIDRRRRRRDPRTARERGE